MTPPDMEARVGRCIAAINRCAMPHPAVPPSWARHSQALVSRWMLARVHPDSPQATVIWTAIGRMGLVEDAE